MSGHTKGEWHAFIDGDVIEVQDENGQPIVSWTGFDDSRRPREEHEANARLIAVVSEAYDYLLINAEKGDLYAQELVNKIHGEEGAEWTTGFRLVRSGLDRNE